MASGMSSTERSLMVDLEFIVDFNLVGNERERRG